MVWSHRGFMVVLGASALFLLLAVGCGAAEPTPTQQLPLVKVGPTGFSIDGAPFKFVGANSINLGFYRQYGFSMDEALRTARENGIKVVRIYLWLGFRPWGARPIEEYDRVLDAAARQGVYVIATLTDCTPGDWGNTKEKYYAAVPQCNLTSDQGMEGLKRDIANILTRKNTVNGKIYRQDTTIMAWDIANEPPLYDFADSEFHAWLETIAPYIKSLDPNHLVTVGTTGWLGDMFDQYGPYYTALNVPALDFFSFHMYPPSGYSPPEAGDSDRYLDSIRFRARTLLSMGKPVVLEEFGFTSYRDLVGTLGRQPNETELGRWLKVYKDQMDVAFTAGVSGAMFWGWGVPETVTVPLWWKNEEHDATETEFSRLIRDYQPPQPQP